MFWKLIRRRLSSETSQRREAETREGGGGGERGWCIPRLSLYLDWINYDCVSKISFTLWTP